MSKLVSIDFRSHVADLGLCQFSHPIDKTVLYIERWSIDDFEINVVAARASASESERERKKRFKKSWVEKGRGEHGRKRTPSSACTPPWHLDVGGLNECMKKIASEKIVRYLRVKNKNRTKKMRNYWRKQQQKVHSKERASTFRKKCQSP